MKTNITKKVNPNEFVYVQWIGSKQPQKVYSPTQVMMEYTQPNKDYNSYGFSNQNPDRILYIHKNDLNFRPQWFRELDTQEKDNFLKYGVINPTDKQKENFETYGVLNVLEKEKSKLLAKQKAKKKLTVSTNKTIEEQKETKPRGRKPTNKKIG